MNAVEERTAEVVLKTLGLQVDEDGIGWLGISVPEEPLNVLNLRLVEDLESMLEQLEKRLGPARGLKGLVIISQKPGAFLAGADLKLIRSAVSAGEAEDAALRIQATCQRIERLPVTTVAAIHGAALGGGLEVALACDYRVAVESAARDIGLVEVQLGLLPAGGGTQRLPRLESLQRVLPQILSSKRLSPRQAWRAGIVDDVVHPLDLPVAARRWAKKPRRPPSAKLTIPERVLESTSIGRSVIFRKAEAGIRKEAGRHYPAPFAALEAVRSGIEQSPAAGFAAEAHHFGMLAVSTTTRNLIDIFLDSNELKREQSQAMPAESSGRIAVIGAGLMGAGIGQAAAMSGITVRVKEVNPDAVAGGLKRMDRLIRQAQRARRLTRYEALDVRSRISGTDSYVGFGRVEMVVEAALESLDLKRSIVAEVESVVDAATVVGTNTSAIPIAQIAAGARRPANIVGIHFFSPVHRMPLVEVVRGPQTSERATATAVAFGRKLGKHVIVVNDGPGFFTTRVLGFMIAEAVRMFEEGAAVEAIDRAMTDFGFPLGPMALMDEVGLDVAVHVSETLSAAFPERLMQSPLMHTLASSDRVGKRSGRGFYLYEKKGRRVDPAIAAMPGRDYRDVQTEEIQERLSLMFVNEAARCLDEGIITNGRDGDLGSIFGVGFPPFLGGPFRYVDLAGAPLVIDRLAALAEAHGPRFAPAKTLSDAAGAGNRLRRGEYPLQALPLTGLRGELLGLVNESPGRSA